MVEVEIEAVGDEYEYRVRTTIPPEELAVEVVDGRLSVRGKTSVELKGGDVGVAEELDWSTKLSKAFHAKYSSDNFQVAFNVHPTNSGGYTAAGGILSIRFPPKLAGTTT